ncbi:MAG: phosphatase PAP2 family protein [candidate division Zixibacteria bacterium]|nr:phosphatase PAP2 family protein [candidate division Zixibacteria bacterium]
MLESLARFDLLFFLFINVWLANPITDFIMPIMTSGQLIVGTYTVCLAIMLWKGDRQLRWMVLFSIIVLVLCDQTASSLLKKWICRPRPCQILSDINLLVGCGAGWSMPSSHATNVFGQFFFFAFFYKHRVWPLLIYACLVAISRVFVGVHYPGDILAGALLGGTIGGVAALAFIPFRNIFIASRGTAAGKQY